MAARILRLFWGLLLSMYPGCFLSIYPHGTNYATDEHELFRVRIVSSFILSTIVPSASYSSCTTQIYIYIYIYILYIYHGITQSKNYTLFFLLLHLIVLVPSESCPNEGTGRPPICLTFTIIAITWAIAEILAFIITRATYNRGFSIFVQIFLVTTALFLFMYVPFTVPSRQFNSWSMPYYVCACWTVWCIYFHSSHQDKYLAVSFPSFLFFILSILWTRKTNIPIHQWISFCLWT